MHPLRMRILAALGSLLITSLLMTGLSGAQTPPDDDDNRAPPTPVSAPVPHEVSEIAVTGMSVRQGGAQDINFFRGEIAQSRIPHPNDFTAEGLLGGHDIQLGTGTACEQLFCLTSESARADLIALPDAQYLVGLAFASNIDPKKWRRQPVNLVAVVDKSGSMSGQPLALVRQSLHEVLEQLGPKDQLSIVLYGDTAEVFMRPTRVTGEGRKSVASAIDRIASAGSTAMERGLSVGYQLAGESSAAFEGTTRVMLFTDERPNVGKTDAGSFMGMAIDASKNGVGLTTVGVGLQFGAELATRISSVRGGNLYFIRDEKDVKALYAGQLDYMVSELAHDLRVTIRPHAGYRIAGIYGVPGQLLGWQGQDAVDITIPTVFLSDKGGAVFFSLTKAEGAAFLPASPVAANETIAAAEVTYLPVATRVAGKHAVKVPAPSSSTSAGMRLGHTLIDEFLALHKAVTAHYVQNDQEAAYQLVRTLAGRLKASPDKGLEGEREMVNGLDERFTFLSGHSSEGAKRSNFVMLWGKWKVLDTDGETDYALGDILEFRPDNTLHVTYRKARDGELEEDVEYVYNNSQVMIPNDDMVFDYRVKEKSLSLRRVKSETRVYLRRQ